MDIDVIGKHVTGLLAFKNKIEALIEGGDEHVDRASAQLDDLLQFKSMVEGALPDLRKAIGDIGLLTADIAKLREDFAPVIAYVEAQKSAKARQSTEPAEKTEGAAPADPDHPLEHIAEVESSIPDADASQRSESEKGSG